MKQKLHDLRPLVDQNYKILIIIYLGLQLNINCVYSIWFDFLKFNKEVVLNSSESSISNQIPCKISDIKAFGNSKKPVTSSNRVRYVYCRYYIKFMSVMTFFFYKKLLAILTMHYKEIIIIAKSMYQFYCFYCFHFTRSIS